MRRFAVTVDGAPLHLQPDLCDDHGSSYLLRVGRVLGELTRDFGQSGRSISAECPCGEGENPLHALMKSHDRPLSNKTGRSTEPCGARRFDFGRDHACAKLGPHNVHEGDGLVWWY